MDFRKLLERKLKFGFYSAIATFIDYLIYITLVYTETQIVFAHIVSYSCGAVINFFFQKKFIFNLNKKGHVAFATSITFSLLGLTLSSVLISYLKDVSFLEIHPILPKIIVTGVVFFYNFYTKRFAFEGFLKKNDTKNSKQK